MFTSRQVDKFTSSQVNKLFAKHITRILVHLSTRLLFFKKTLAFSLLFLYLYSGRLLIPK